MIRRFRSAVSPRHLSTLALAAATLAVLAAPLLWAAPAAARVGDQRVTLFVGTTSHTDGDASTFGTAVGVMWALEFTQDFLWTISGEYAATSGEQEEGGQKYEIDARTTTVRSGITYLINNDPGSAVVGLVGGGLSLLSYNIDYRYPGSEVGETSGVGPGVFGFVGAEFRLTRNFHFIPQYVVSAHAIETEDGDTFTLYSNQLIVAFRLSF